MLRDIGLFRVNFGSLLANSNGIIINKCHLQKIQKRRRPRLLNRGPQPERLRLKGAPIMAEGLDTA